MRPTSECSGCERSDRKFFHGVEPTLASDAPTELCTFQRLAPATQWPAVNPQERLIPVRVALYGEDDGVAFNSTITLGQGFEFRSVPPGKYRLQVHVPDREVELWDEMLTVETGQETVVTLTSSMSPVSPRDFPAAASAGVQGGR